MSTATGKELLLKLRQRFKIEFPSDAAETLERVHKSLSDNMVVTQQDATHQVIGDYSDWWDSQSTTRGPKLLAVSEDYHVEELYVCISKMYELKAPLTLGEKRTAEFKLFQELEICGNKLDEKSMDPELLVGPTSKFLELIGTVMVELYPWMETLHLFVLDGSGKNLHVGVPETFIRLVWPNIIVDKTRAFGIMDTLLKTLQNTDCDVFGGFVGFLLYYQLNPTIFTVSTDVVPQDPRVFPPSTNRTRTEDVPIVDTAVDTSLGTWPEDCLLHQGLPNPMVYGPDGVWMEVSFLNSRIMESSYRTRPAKCPARGWHNDDVGRPLLDSTQVLLQKAKQVGHPRNGMLNPKVDLVIPKHCSRAVPKIIHFIWLCSPLADKRAENLRGFAKHNPNFRIFFWTDAEIPPSARKLLTEPRPNSVGPVEVKDAYAEAQSFQSWELIQYLDKFHSNRFNPGVCTLKSHFFRLEAPLKYGGIYIDMDHVSKRGFDEVGGDLWRWPFVTQKVCGVNIGNHIFSGEKGSSFLDFAVKVIIERCEKLSSCNVLEGTGPPPFAMSFLRYNASDIMLIPSQQMADAGLASHISEHSWR